MKKKKYNARFPPARIKKIMQTDEDVGKVAQPVPVIISRALELFVENLLKKANDITSQRGARTLTPSHLKMCIKSEKRFDFLKELVSTVPDVQGDHDGDPAGAPGSAPHPPGDAVGLDLTMSTLSAANSSATASTNQEINPQNTSTLPASAQRPSKFPRQLSTPRPRGRPRTVSLDSETSKLPKKQRKKKRQHKYVDDDFSGSDLSNNGDIEVFENHAISASGGATSGGKFHKQGARQQTSGGPISGFDGAISGSAGATSGSGGNGQFHNINSSKDEAIVTCTVTTGLTTNQFNGYNNGTSGSILGFTLSIPSTSLSGSADLSNNPNPEGIGRTGNGSFSNSAPLSSPTFTESRQYQQLKKSNGLNSSTAKDSGALYGLTEKVVPAKNKKINEPFPVPALVIQDSRNETQKQNNTVQDEVDEDYDDF